MVSELWWYIGGMVAWILGVAILGIYTRLMAYQRAVERWIESTANPPPRGHVYFHDYGGWMFPVAIPGCIIWPLMICGFIVVIIGEGCRRAYWWVSEGVFDSIERRVIRNKKTLVLTSPNPTVREKARAVLTKRKILQHEDCHDDQIESR